MVNQKAGIWPLFWAGSVQWGSFSHLYSLHSHTYTYTQQLYSERSLLSTICYMQFEHDYIERLFLPLQLDSRIGGKVEKEIRESPKTPLIKIMGHPCIKT
mgnify:CR=1 FL=1